MSEFLSRIEKLSPKRLALLAVQLQTRLDRIEAERGEPIAIIGMGCRFPGAPNPEVFWRLLEDGRDAVSSVPSDRWDIDALFDPDPDASGRIASRWGGFLDRVDTFDAPFFGISRREAVSMDPQQRLALEVAWEALEHAGQSPRELSGTQTGVFLGMSTNDYYGILRSRGLEAIDAYMATGSAHSVAAGRIAYVLGLQGPNVAIDTACSSSLIAIHLACQSLRMSECRLAIAGGVNVIAAPEVTVALSRSHMMAPDGRCKAFDAAADGFVRGEGCGMLVLKRL
jgi:acyl transferase domain-containing protein